MFLGCGEVCCDTAGLEILQREQNGIVGFDFLELLPDHSSTSPVVFNDQRSPLSFLPHSALTPRGCARQTRFDARG